MIYSLKLNFHNKIYVKLITYLISAYLVLFTLILNIKNFEEYNNGTRHSYGFLNDSFINNLQDICLGKGNVLSFPLSQVQVIIENKYENSYYVGNSPLNIFCDKYHIYSFSHVTSYLDDYQNFLHNVSIKNSDYFKNLFNEKSIEQILIYKNLDLILNSEFFISNFNIFKPNYNINNFIYILNDIEYELFNEDDNFLYYKKKWFTQAGQI